MPSSRLKRRFHLFFIIVAFVAAVTANAQDSLWLSTFDLTKMRQSWSQPQRDRSVARGPLCVRGEVFSRGVGTHASSTFRIRLGGKALRFRGSVGVDDSSGSGGTVRFKLVGDGQLLFDSGIMRSRQAARRIDIDLRGVGDLVLAVRDAEDGISYDHADWCDARILFSGERPAAVDPPYEEPVILTPPPGPSPRINGPSVYGCGPEKPFLYRIPCTGTRPITFAAQGLPSSLHLDADRGIISGTSPGKGRYTVTLGTKNAHGSAEKTLTIVSGEGLALTPPMGWNHWYAHYGRVTDRLVREAADLMVSSGMADAGYMYVSIDDCWMNTDRSDDSLRFGPFRDTAGDIVPNRHFPDMKALTGHIHNYGLKAGIYTSPGPKTCAGFAGAYQHEARDAARFADWGFDLLKYDWCYYRDVAGGDNSPEALRKPYRIMGNLLQRQPRDIIYNLCQYGMGNVWEWGAEVGGHSWRTAGDLGYELDRVFEVALTNAGHRAWSRPGSWNDPDYIQIGHIGSARTGGLPAPCPLGPNEQYAYMSLWCLMASPLFFSGDMTRLDPFTLNVLCNPEVIEVNQDPLGQCAAVAELTDEKFVMIKVMADGSTAVGLFNRGEFPGRVTAPWALLGLQGKYRVRDLWRQKEIGEVTGELSADVPRHGGMLFRLYPVCN
jgi:alpha-galactosidase